MTAAIWVVDGWTFLTCRHSSLCDQGIGRDHTMQEQIILVYAFPYSYTLTYQFKKTQRLTGWSSVALLQKLNLVQTFCRTVLPCFDGALCVGNPPAPMDWLHSNELEGCMSSHRANVVLNVAYATAAVAKRQFSKAGQVSLCALNTVFWTHGIHWLYLM